jgi:predicted RNase H-like HicB family nuclease
LAPSIDHPSIEARSDAGKKPQIGFGLNQRAIPQRTSTLVAPVHVLNVNYGIMHETASALAERDHPETGMNQRMTAIIEREGNMYVALCPELDIASQGDSIEHARENLREALELFFETASKSEIAQRVSGEIYVTQVEVAVG